MHYTEVFEVLAVVWLAAVFIFVVMSLGGAFDKKNKDGDI